MTKIGDATVVDRVLLGDAVKLTLNQHSAEVESNTPDFILADLLMAVLRASDEAIKQRDQWYGVKLAPGTDARFQTTSTTKALVAELERRCANLDPHIKAAVDAPERFPTFLHAYSDGDLIADLVRRNYDLKTLRGADPADIACELRRQGCVFRINQGDRLSLVGLEAVTVDQLEAELVRRGAVRMALVMESEAECQAVYPAISKILQERARQFRMGYDAAHDDSHDDGSIGRAAALVLAGVVEGMGSNFWKQNPPTTWEARCALKVATKFQDETDRLVIAASLLSAEIDRRLRLNRKHEAKFAKAADRMAGHRATANYLESAGVSEAHLERVREQLDITDDLAEIRNGIEAILPVAPLAAPGDVVWKDPKDCDIIGDLERVRDQMVADVGYTPEPERIGGAGMFNGPRAAELPDEVWQAQTVQAFQMWSGSGGVAPDGYRLEYRAKGDRGGSRDWLLSVNDHPTWAAAMDWRMVPVPEESREIFPVPGSIQMPRQNLLSALDTALGFQIATDCERGVDSVAAAGLRSVRNVVAAGGSVELVD